VIVGLSIAFASAWIGPWTGPTPGRIKNRQNDNRRSVTVIQWLASSPYALWVNQSYGWPLALTIHAFGNAIVVGFMAIIAMRLFGYFPGIPYSSLRSLIPYIWISVAFQVFSGFINTLWMTKPAQYLADGMFELKFTLVIVASVVMVSRELRRPILRPREETTPAASIWPPPLSGFSGTTWAGVERA
jgi:hypothetical protein